MAQYTFYTLKDLEFAGISLPSGYQRVEWLQSTGTQYIKIPCQLNAINSISTKYKSAIGWTFGNCVSGDGSQGLMLYQQATTAVSWFGNRQYQDNLPYNSTNSYTKIVAGDDAANVPSSLNAIGIFCNLYQNNVSNRTPSTYYYFITNLFSLVACRRTSDSVAGMYGIADGVFYPNAGTGTFSIGGDAPTYNFQNGDDIIISSTKTHYHYQDGNLVFYYQEIPPLVFKGITFEQTDYWQRPEMVFRGLSFEGENILRYYGVKIDVNGETERNYIPCIRTSDGIAGMYDTVNGVFYASVGTNNFTT